MGTYCSNITRTNKYMSNKSRNIMSSKSKNPTPIITQHGGRGIVALEGVGWGIGGGYDYVPLLKAHTHSKCSYSSPLLKGSYS